MSRKLKKTSPADDPLLVGLRRGTAADPAPAYEQFPSSENIAQHPVLGFDAVNREGKLILGTVGSQMDDGFASGGVLVGTRDDRHATIIAPARSGKSRSHLLPILLTYPGSIVVIDVKGDLASETARYRSEVLGQKTVVLDPFDAAAPCVSPYRDGAGFNPMAGVDPSDADAVIDRAESIAASLVTRSGRESDPHWNDVAQQTIEGVITHVLTSPLYTDACDLGTVARLLGEKSSSPDGERSSLECEMRTNEALDGAITGAAAAIFDKSERELASTLSSVRRHLHWLTYPRMRRVVSEGALDIGAIQHEPTTVYLSLPVRKLSSCSGWLRMMLDCVLAAFESGEQRRQHQTQTGGHRTLAIIDEMPALGRMPSLEIAAGQVAGLGLKLIFVAQDLAQLKAVYPHRWQTFLGNSGTVTIFGAQDTETLEWASRRLGQTSILSHSESEGSLHGILRQGQSGKSASVQTHPLMTTAEIARFFSRDDPFARQLVISAGFGPLILQRVAYDKHPALRDLLNKS